MDSTQYHQASHSCPQLLVWHSADDLLRSSLPQILSLLERNATRTYARGCLLALLRSFAAKVGELPTAAGAAAAAGLETKGAGSGSGDSKSAAGSSSGPVLPGTLLAQLHGKSESGSASSLLGALVRTVVLSGVSEDLVDLRNSLKVGVCA